MADVKQDWKLQSGRQEHQVQAELKLVQLGMKYALYAYVDGKVVVENVQGKEIFGEHEFSVGDHKAVLKIERPGGAIGKWQLDLKVDGQSAPPDGRLELAGSTPGPESASSGEPGGMPMVPSTPANCPSCGAPANLNNIRWNGPATAECGSCGSTLEISWKKL